MSVTSPAPGGGTSGNSAFSINGPAPAVTSLSPSTANAGGAAFTLTVNGSGFVGTSVVNWNGSPRTTTFVSATQLHAAILATDIAAAATAQVTVSNPAPGGGVSGNSAFTINALNPVPKISALSPASSTAGGPAFTMTVTGTGFIGGSVVKWNGSSRTTFFVSATQVHVAILARDIAAVGLAQVTVFNPAPGGGTSPNATFSIKAASKPHLSTPTGAVTETSASSVGTSSLLPGNAVAALSCLPKAVNAAGLATCELRFSAAPVARQFQLTSSSTQVKIPAVIFSRPNQSTLTFQASIEPAAKQQSAVVTATLGDSIAQDTILITPDVRPLLRTPEKQIAKFGGRLTFNVTAVDPNDLPLQLVASGMPAGASFDPAIGRFEWIPSASQAGTYHVAFAASNSAGRSSTAQVTIEVDSGTPVLVPSERFACSPGSIAELTGKWLAAPGVNLSDPSGNSTDLGGTRVKVNGQYASVLFSSATLVKFVCPGLDAGTEIAVSVETRSATSNPLTTGTQKATPVILSPQESAGNQGLISFVGTTDIAMDRNFRIAAHPAQPGDQILIWATGLGTAALTPRAVSVKLADVYAQVDSVQAVSGFAGLYTILVRIPDSAISGNAVPVQLDVATPDGHWFQSNRATLAIEPVSQ